MYLGDESLLSGYLHSRFRVFSPEPQLLLQGVHGVQGVSSVTRLLFFMSKKCLCIPQIFNIQGWLVDIIFRFY